MPLCCWLSHFSCSVMSNSLWPHGLQHTKLPCPSPYPRVCANSCPLSQWCHPTISSSIVFFSSCLQSFPASESFPMSWLFTSGGQSIRTSCPINSYLTWDSNFYLRRDSGSTFWLLYCSNGIIYYVSTGIANEMQIYDF